MAETMQSPDSFDFDDDYGREYDYIARTVIPGYDTVFKIVRALLRERIGENAEVLIVGAGTGKELAEFATVQDDWRFTAVDPSKQMIDFARRVAEQNGTECRVTLHHGYASDLSEDPQFDAATIINVMHFLADDGTKQALVESVAQRVKSGGVIVLFDLHGAPRTDEFQLAERAWVDYMKGNGLTGQQLEKFIDRLHSGIVYVPESRIMEIVASIGLEVEMQFYRALLYGGWLLRKT